MRHIPGLQDCVAFFVSGRLSAVRGIFAFLLILFFYRLLLLVTAISMLNRVLWGVIIVVIAALGYAVYLWLVEGDAARLDANLGFEVRGKSGGPAGWGYKGVRYRVSLDSSIRHTGARSLKLEAFPSDSLEPSIKFFHRFPLDYSAGKKLRLSVWIRTEAVLRGSANMYVNFLQDDSVIFRKTLDGDTIRGTSGWKQYTTEFTITKEAQNQQQKYIEYGVYAKGDGTVWFDDVMLELNGKPFTDFIDYRPGG